MRLFQRSFSHSLSRGRGGEISENHYCADHTSWRLRRISYEGIWFLRPNFVKLVIICHKCGKRCKRSQALWVCTKGENPVCDYNCCYDCIDRPHLTCIHIATTQKLLPSIRRLIDLYIDVKELGMIIMEYLLDLVPHKLRLVERSSARVQTCFNGPNCNSAELAINDVYHFECEYGYAYCLDCIRNQQKRESSNGCPIA